MHRNAKATWTISLLFSVAQQWSSWEAAPCVTFTTADVDDVAGCYVGGPTALFRARPEQGHLRRQTQRRISIASVHRKPAAPKIT
mmetsp:Transcript_32266/g.70717  ORF Transcript_32266/g.70717 Transcript_32266/m.70717 type:complete len:85 (+) Transcript_32266:371-625(+)